MFSETGTPGRKRRPSESLSFPAAKAIGLSAAPDAAARAFRKRIVTVLRANRLENWTFPTSAAAGEIEGRLGYRLRPDEGDGGGIARHFVTREILAGYEEAHFSLRIDNYDAIERLSGEGIASRLADEVASQLQDFLEGESFDGGEIVSRHKGYIDVIVCSLTTGCRQRVRECCLKIAATPLRVSGKIVIPVLSLGWPPVELAAHGLDRDTVLLNASRNALRAQATATEAFVSRGAAWSEAVYDQAALMAAQVFGATKHADFALAWQPVRHVDSGQDLLYSEALLRFVDSRGNASSAGQALQAIERLGCAPASDYRIVSRVVDELQAHPDICLGVNISAQSAVLDYWWTDIIARLAADRSLGARLYVEITETAPLTSIAEAVEFADKLRSLGCKIVIDDFGIGHSSLRVLVALRPDVVKIDTLYLHRAMTSMPDLEIFQNLVRLAQSLAPAVIVEGVETEAHSATARAAGAVWQQGLFLGSPSLSRNGAVTAARQCSAASAWNLRTRERPRLGGSDDREEGMHA
jgi:EAL domain-containing protein (putative c-di-GMP-specific phosphodiesterase class I)